MDESERERARWVVFNPTESLTIELKAWTDPALPEAQAKIVKGAMALHNRGGGSLVIGFDDTTLQPYPNPIADVRAAYHVDDVQQLISKYSSEPFEIGVEFVERDSQEHPVILIPGGVRTPVAVKKQLTSASAADLLKVGDVPFRTLRANGSFSTANARPEDWGQIVQICFENREADIGRFVRRHLSGLDARVIGTLASAFNIKSEVASPSLQERAQALLNVGRTRYEAVKALRGIATGAEEAVLRWGTWEVAAIIDPAIEWRVADQQFYDLLLGNHPQYRPWPSWPDVRAFQDAHAKPETREGAWESLLIAIKPGGWPHDFLNFMRLDPVGKFYQLRALEDDALARARGARVGNLLDPSEVVIQVADSIVVAMRFAQALGCDNEKTNLGFAFRWRGLANRNLVATSGRIVIPPGHAASDDEASSFVQVPLATAETALAPIVERAVKGLFATFRGYSMPGQMMENLIRRLLSKSAS